MRPPFSISVMRMRTIYFEPFKGILNPVIPDARYNCKLGLGTPLEQRLNPGGFNQSESSNGKPPMTAEEIKKEAEERLNALPSYLKKKQIEQREEKSKKNEIIPFEDMVQIKTKFKMKEMDLNLEKLKDRDYLRLIKVKELFLGLKVGFFNSSTNGFLPD